MATHLTDIHPGAFKKQVGKTVPAVDGAGTRIGWAKILDADGLIEVTLDDGQTYKSRILTDARVPR